MTAWRASVRVSALIVVPQIILFAWAYMIRRLAGGWHEGLIIPYGVLSGAILIVTGIASCVWLNDTLLPAIEEQEEKEAQEKKKWKEHLDTQVGIPRIR